MKCPKCSTFLIKSSNYCNKCGFNIKTDKNATFLWARELFAQKEYDEAKEYYKISCRLGNSDAMCDYGIKYFTKFGRTPNTNHLLYCMKKAIEIDHNKQAYIFLINSYLDGNDGITTDFNTAKAIYNSIPSELKPSFENIKLRIEVKEKELFKKEENFDQENIHVNTKTNTKKPSANYDDNFNKFTSTKVSSNTNFLNEEENTTIPIGEIINIKGSFNVFEFETIEFKKDGSEFEEEKINLDNFIKKADSKIKYLKENKFQVEDDNHMIDWDMFLDQRYKKRINERDDKEILNLEEMKKCPYSFRLVVQYDDGSIEDVYVGKKDYFDFDFNIKIISWYSPLGNKVYDDVETQWNEIIDKKSRDIKLNLKRKITIDDSNLIDVFELYNIKNGIFFNTQLEDSHLQIILKKRHKENKISNIINSIQYNQNRIITSNTKNNMIMQGCAGCGKTMVLFHRLKFMIARKKLNNQTTFILTPSNIFNTHIKPLIDDLELTNIALFTIDAFYNKLLSLYTNGNWDLLFKARNLFNTKKLYVKKDSDLPNEVVNYYYSKEFENSVMSLEKTTNTHLTYSGVHKKKNSVNENGEIDIMNVLLGEREKKLLPKYTRKYGIIHKCELFALCLFLYRKDSNGQIKKSIDINMMMIDEAQDISISELNLLKSIFPNTVFNLFGDIGQTITPYGITNWEDLKNIIGNVDYYEFNKNYRNSAEIIEYVNARCNKKMESVGYESYPVCTISLTELIDVYNNDTLGRKAIICSPTQKDFLRETLHAQYIYSVSEIKGVEFNSIYVYLEDMTLNEQYVALTRSLDKLTIIEK